MSSGADLDITSMLQTWVLEEGTVPEPLFEFLYPELRRVAFQRLARERDDCSVQVTELVHEAYLRMASQNRIQYQDRLHFLAVSSTVMRWVLVDRHRARQRKKRGANPVLVSLDDTAEPVEEEELDLWGLHLALKRLEAANPSAARIVELRYFGGLSLEDVAELLGIGRSTAFRRWTVARAWLKQELGRDETPDADEQAG